MGFTIDLFQGLLFVPGIKLKRVLSDTDSLLEANCCTTRELSALAGRINSFKLDVGNVPLFIQMLVTWGLEVLLRPRGCYLSSSVNC